MPILPTPGATPYDLLNKVLNTARNRLNDAFSTLFPVSGKLLQNNNAQTLQIVNTAYRKLQEYLANLGYTRLTREAIVEALPVVGSKDPASQAYINWFNYFDGQNLWTSPLLPSDLIIPLEVWERVSGQQSGFSKMEMILDGIPAWAKQALNCRWEWREDSLYLPGAQQSVDLRLRYAAYLPDFADVGMMQWFEQPVPILRCMDAFAYYICAEVLEAREDVAENPFIAKAESAATKVMNRDVRAKQRVNVRRIPRSGRTNGGGWGGGWC